MQRTFLAAAAAVVAAGAAAFAPAAASASVTPKALINNTITVTNGEAGYFDQAVNIRMGDIHAQLNLTQAAANLFSQGTITTGRATTLPNDGQPVIPVLPNASGRTGPGAMGIQLCAQGSGEAVQLGAVYGNLSTNQTPAPAWYLGFTVGNVSGPVPTGTTTPPCQGGVMQPGNGNLVYLVTDAAGNPITVPTGTQLRLEISTGRLFNGSGRYVSFSAVNEATGAVIFDTGRVPFAQCSSSVINECFSSVINEWPQFNQAGAGIQDVAPNGYVLNGGSTPVTFFSYVHVADYAGQGQYLIGRWPTSTVETANNQGSGTGNVDVWPTGAAGGHFTVNSLPVISTARHR